MFAEKLNESQRKAVEYNGKHLLVLAGAGTGNFFASASVSGNL